MLLTMEQKLDYNAVLSTHQYKLLTKIFEPANLSIKKGEKKVQALVKKNIYF